MPEFEVKAGKAIVKGKKTKDGHLEYVIPGDGQIQVDWKNAKS
jgi:hypothetical protein